MNKLLYISRIILYTIIVFLFSLFSPWWIIAIAGTFIGFYSKTGYNAIIDSTISLSIAWLIMLINNLFIQDYIIINKIQFFLGVNSITLLFVTLIIPILIGLLSSLFGYELKKVIRYEK